MYRKILVPVDGSSHSQFTLTQAVALASRLGTDVSVTVLHVGSYAALADVSMVVDIYSMLEEEGRAILAKTEQTFLGTTVVHDGKYLSGDPSELICRTAEEGAYDLIVIGNRGRGLFAELLLGSVSHKVIQHAPCPVLVIRAGKK